MTVRERFLPWRSYDFFLAGRSLTKQPLSSTSEGRKMKDDTTKLSAPKEGSQTEPTNAERSSATTHI